MSFQDLMETETTAARWIGRLLAVVGIVLIAFWIGGGV